MGAYFIDNVYRQCHECKVIDYHWSFKLEGFPIGHKTGSEVQYKEQVAQQYRRHGNGTLHEWITSHPWIWGGGETRKTTPFNRRSTTLMKCPHDVRVATYQPSPRRSRRYPRRVSPSPEFLAARSPSLSFATQFICQNTHTRLAISFAAI